MKVTRQHVYNKLEINYSKYKYIFSSYRKKSKLPVFALEDASVDRTDY